jgi:hypothetical protein
VDHPAYLVPPPLHLQYQPEKRLLELELVARRVAATKITDELDQRPQRLLMDGMRHDHIGLAPNRAVHQ